MGNIALIDDYRVVAPPASEPRLSVDHHASNAGAVPTFGQRDHVDVGDVVDLADPFESVLHDAHLQRELVLGRGDLKVATATTVGDFGTCRLDTLRRRFDDFDDPSSVETLLGLKDFDQHPFVGQCTVDKHHAPVRVAGDGVAAFRYAAFCQAFGGELQRRE